MYVIRRRAVILFSLCLFLTTLFYIDHSIIHGVKRAFSSFGLIDSRHILVGMSDVRSDDHVRGQEDAEIFLVEYSDFSCLMCAVMQETFDRIVSEQKILLVSRHLYPRQENSSFRLAVAAECVAKHAGEEAYASFAQYLYSSQHVSEALEDVALQQQAVSLGVEVNVFQRCVENDASVRARIERDSEEGWRLGARGTPYIVVVYKGKPVGISYANRYDAFLKRVTLLVGREKLHEEG